MSASPQSRPAASKKTPPVWVLITAPIVVAIAAFVFVCRERARAEWPREHVEAIRVPPSPFPVDPEAWHLLQRAVAAAPPREADRTMAVLESNSNDAADAWHPYEASLALFDDASTRSGVAFPPARAESPTDVIQLIRIARARVVRARDQSATDVSHALADLSALESFATRMAFADGTLISAVVGMGIGILALREIAHVVQTRPTISTGDLERVQAALETESESPGPVARAFAIECAVHEPYFRNAVDPAAFRTGPPPSEPSHSSARRPAWIYDVERTIDAYRARCRDVFALASVPFSERRAIPPLDLRERPAAPWRYVDNPMGRRLLQLLDPMTVQPFNREDLRVTERAGTITQIALVRWTRDHQGELPPTLDALVPTYLRRAPAALQPAAEWEYRSADRRLVAHLPVPIRPSPRRRDLEWHL